MLSNLSLAQGNPVKQCFTELENNSELQPLKNKVKLGFAKDQSIQMLANKEKPNAKDRALLLKWDEMRNECMTPYLAWLQNNTSPAIVALSKGSISSFKSSLAALYAGDITYGEFAKRRQEISDKVDTEMAKIQGQQRRDEVAQQQHDAQIQAQNDAQSRALAAQIILNNQPKPYQLPTPVIQAPQPLQAIQPSINTNCTPNGAGGFNCRTY